MICLFSNQFSYGIDYCLLSRGGRFDDFVRGFLFQGFSHLLFLVMENMSGLNTYFTGVLIFLIFHQNLLKQSGYLRYYLNQLIIQILDFVSPLFMKLLYQNINSQQAFMKFKLPTLRLHLAMYVFANNLTFIFVIDFSWVSYFYFLQIHLLMIFNSRDFKEYFIVYFVD